MSQCPFCGTPASPEARFCKECGRQLQGQHASAQKAVLSDDFDVSAVDRLRRERTRLSTALNELLGAATDRELTDAERGRWNAFREEYRKVTHELSARLQHLSERQARDRRQQGERRSSERRREQAAITFDDRRSGMARRVGERRSGKDRRAPFEDLEP